MALRGFALILALGAGCCLFGCTSTDSNGPALSVAPNSADPAALAPGAEEPNPARVSLSGDGSSEDYKISPRDVLQVTVFQVPDLNRTVQVDNTGSITLPLINSIRVSGLTMRQAQDDITAQLSRSYLRNPQVTLSLVKSGQRVTVNGAVRTPQVITVDGQLTLSQAIAQTGGTNEVSNSERIHVARVFGGHVSDQIYDLQQIQAGKAPDPALRGGDIVVVEESQTKVAFKNVKDLLPFAAIGAFLSDERVKTDLKPLYVRADGITIYAYRYKWSSIRYVGVLAQDVEKVRSDAVFTGDDGFERVDYRRLGMEMQSCKVWMASRRPSQQRFDCRLQTFGVRGNSRRD